MQAWCTPQEVAALVAGSPPADVLQDYADLATETLFIMSGRAFSGRTTITTMHQIDRRGYVRLVEWQPVRNLIAAQVDGIPVRAALSPAGTFVVLPRHMTGRVVSLTIDVGQDPPRAARNAAAALAADMLRGDPRYAALSPAPGDVRQSSRITAVTRQGVSFTYADPASLAENDLTGVQSVDLFIKSVNPLGSRYQPKVVTA